LAANYLEGVLDDAKEWFLDRRTVRMADGRPTTTVLYASLYAALVLALSTWISDSGFKSNWYRHWWQPDQYDAAAWIATNTPPDARIGAFNAGIPAYFSRRPVVNLDGVVNRDAHEALRNCRTSEYIHEIGLEYVSDTLTAFRMAGCGLDLEADLEREATAGTVIITRVRSR
jgi:hypothetical protein